MLFEEIRINYFHPLLNIGMADIRNVWLLNHHPVKFITIVHQGNLHYRIPGTRKRISYNKTEEGFH